MKLYNKWILSAIVLAFSAVFLFSAGMAGAAIDGGYVGTDVCLACHDGGTASDKTSFTKTGHPYKYKHTGGVQPTNWIGDFLTPTYAGLDSSIRDYFWVSDGGSPALLDWSAINYTVGGYGWKLRFGILDFGQNPTVNPTGNQTGYVWSGTLNQYHLETDAWGAQYSGYKPYSCAVCHNTNGTNAYSAGSNCNTDLGSPRTEPWAKNAGLSSSNPGGYKSEWTFDGVQCEACHGPGEGHGEAGTISVLKITKGTPTTADDVEICAKCHVRSNNSGSPVFDSECGVEDSFSGTYAILTKGATGTDPWIGHHEQYNELQGLNGDGVHASLKCTTCHDPHKRAAGVISAVASALGITPGEDNTKAAPGAIKAACTSCHYGKDVDGGGAQTVAGHSTLTCIDCHMPEATKTATASATSGWGRKADLKTHIFKINASTSSIWRTSPAPDSKNIAQNYLTPKYACGKCHDGVIGTATTMTENAAVTAASGYHGAAIVNVDGGYVGTDVCLTCHTNKESFLKSGHPWKYEFTGGATPPATAPLAAAFSAQRPLEDLTWLDGNAAQDEILCPGGTCSGGLLDWGKIGYTVGGFGWKLRWGINDSTDAMTGYLWTGPKHQYKLEDGGYQQVYTSANSPKKYECATCHNTNGIVSTTGYSCYTDPGTAGAPARTEPWASTGLDPVTHGGYYSSWSLDGVQCEACHGAGLDHATAASAANITVNESKDLCGKCHTRSTNTSGQGSECGGDANAAILANGAQMADSNYINHHEQYNEMVGLNDGVHKTLDCVSCHNPHIRTTNVVSAVATALDITDNGDSAETRGAVVSCNSCHASTAPLAADGGADTKITTTAHGSSAGCIDCHMGEMSKTTSNTEQGTWGKKGDLKTHIFAIDSAATTISRPNADLVTVAQNYITVDYACGKCHDVSMSSSANVTFSRETAQMYASVMHGGAATGGPVSPDPVADPDSCDPLVLAATFGCAEVGGIETCNLGTPGHVDLDTTGTTSGAVITVWWGDGSGLNEPSAIEHTYNKIGRNQVIVTAANTCGEKTQEVMIVNTTGGVAGKGTLTIAADGTDGRKVSYSVLNASNVSITNGNITLDGSKSMTLDSAANYSVKIGYEAVQPYTDPVTYRSCDLVGTEIGKCSHPAYANQTTCEAAGKLWQITGQLITPVAVTTGATTTVSLTGCN